MQLESLTFKQLWCASALISSGFMHFVEKDSRTKDYYSSDFIGVGYSGGQTIGSLSSDIIAVGVLKQRW